VSGVLKAAPSARAVAAAAAAGGGGGAGASSGAGVDGGAAENDRTMDLEQQVAALKKQLAEETALCARYRHHHNAEACC